MPEAIVHFYGTRKFDRLFFPQTVDDGRLEIKFLEIPLSSETALTAAGAAAVCVFVHDSLDAPCLHQLREVGVKHAALRCAGFNFVDLEAAGELGISVTRVPAYSPSAVAEHAVALLLALNRKIHRAYARTREHDFSIDGLVGFDLEGKTAGVIGCGKIGRKAAQIFRGFGMRVLGHDIAPDPAWAAEHGVEFADLPQLLAAADVLSLHTPLTDETRYLIDADSLASMKRGAFLVNTSRGGLVNTDALIEALHSGQLGGVALDVYEEEEAHFFHDRSEEILEDKRLAYLLTLPNVLVTAHQAFLTREALSEIAETTLSNLRALRDGTPFLSDTILVDRP